MTRTYFEPSIRAAAVERYVAGESSGDVARAVGCSVPAVLEWLQKAGVAIRSRTGAQSPRGERLRAAARTAGQSSQPPAPAPTRRRYDAAIMARAVERYAAGESSYVIAREVGCTGPTVLDWVRRAGVAVKSNQAAPQRPASVPQPRISRPPLRGPVQDDDEACLDVRRLQLPPTPSDAEVTLRLVNVEGDLRVIARARDMQASWGAADVNAWGRGVLALFARAATPCARPNGEARRVR
jgi:transposase-like protein